MSDFFEVKDEELAALKDKVVVITGCSSGIGLATTSLILSLGGKVVGGDINPPTQSSSIADNPDFTFARTDVAVWTDLVSLFKTAISAYKHVDHVFANAGIGPSANYLDDKFDPDTGDLLEPSFRTYDVNLRGVVNTSTLAFHHMRKQLADPSLSSNGAKTGYSVTMTSSASAFQRFSIVDYATAKHGVIGFLRGMTPALAAAGLSSDIRINAIAPSWTVTGLLPEGRVERFGKKSQPAMAVARSVACLMADQTRNGQLIYSIEGKYREIEEGLFLRTVEREIFRGDPNDNTVLERINAQAKEQEAMPTQVTS